MSQEQDREQDLKRVTDAVNTLIEHFDSVQIFTTRHDSAEAEGTINLNVGAGNWFARVGHVRDWLIRQDEQTRENVRKPE